jgi:D-3-phosphoglycerate dehydrogenase
MINEQRLKLVRTNVVILNFSRDGVVDDAAVVAAINAGKVYAYVCDFPSNLLKSHPRVIVLPHLGASTHEAEENCAVMVVEQVRDFLENGKSAIRSTSRNCSCRARRIPGGDCQ